MGKLDAIGYTVCHRISSHSFSIGDQQMPLCARCTGEFDAAAVALVFMGFVSHKRNRMPSRGILAVLALFFLAFGIDGSNSYLALLKSSAPGVLTQIPNLYITNNTSRLFTGSGMGVAVATILYPVLNQTIWRQSENERALDWKSFGILVAIILLIDFGVLTDSPIVLYPVAVASSMGVLALLTTVFGILWITLMRQENSFDSLHQLWLPALAGLTLALLMIVSIDLVRYNLTHTWSGFPGLGG